jgi:hypothetical protein
MERITSNPTKGFVPHRGFGNLHEIGENHFLRKFRAMGRVYLLHKEEKKAKLS